MHHWSLDSVFYHIYPLGLTGAPQRNDFSLPPESRLEQVHPWIDHLKGLGVNALYLGPLFESSSHGYDTAHLFHVDRRLGTDETLRQLSAALHENGIRLVLDGVFHHVGRDFWAFRDVLERGQDSQYCEWFANLRFGAKSNYGDPFGYEGWAGHYDLVKLNLHNPAVREHLLSAVDHWMREFHLDGLRLDAADVLDPGFMRELSTFCRERQPDFWLMGEVVHGDYRKWVQPGLLDSVTNFECYKGLYSSLADKNYFEIAYALNRQFGAGGIYAGLPLYIFADNHDVNRVASDLKKLAHLYPLYFLLFTMPGVPSLYYGSEWGLKGKKHGGSDAPMRPALDIATAAQGSPAPELAAAIARLAKIRKDSAALRYGDYEQLHVSHEQLAFARRTPEQHVVVMLNASDQPAAFDIAVKGPGRTAVDLLDPNERYGIVNGRLKVPAVAPNWGRVLAVA